MSTFSMPQTSTFLKRARPSSLSFEFCVDRSPSCRHRQWIGLLYSLPNKLFLSEHPTRQEIHCEIRTNDTSVVETVVPSLAGIMSGGPKAMKGGWGQEAGLKTFFGWSLLSGAALITICSILVHPFGNVNAQRSNAPLQLDSNFDPTIAKIV